MDLRAYQPGDDDACLAVFDSNVPEYFSAAERAEFASFLRNAPASYFVMDHDGAVVGCGGYAIENADSASLSWLMVRRDLHRNGLGRFLVYATMRRVTAEADPAMLHVRTSPQAAGFFDRQGFRLVGSPNGRMEMSKKLKVCP